MTLLAMAVLMLAYWYRPGDGSGGAGGQRTAPQTSAHAVATFVASPRAPNLEGTVSFHEIDGGTWIKVEVHGLPEYHAASGDSPPKGPHGFHLHEKGVCEIGDPDSPFASAGGHWNPDDQPHGNHAGDFPVLFSDRGSAFLSFVTHRFTPADIVGLSVIIHENPDDYRSQPAGDSGPRIGCAVIEAVQD